MRSPLGRVAVAERSMEPVLRPGDCLLVWRGLRRNARGRAGALDQRRAAIRVRPGQIVIARNPQRPDMLLVKRAAWLEPEGWWLDSDNPRAGAVDSVRLGLIPPELIEGLVLFRYWPVLRRS